MPKYLLLLFIFCMNMPLLAQKASIKGKISTWEGKNAEFVHVFLDKTTFGYLVDETGKFELKNIPIGEYNLVVSGVGYAKKSIAISLKAGQALQMDIVLQPDVKLLQEVSVIAQKTPEQQISETGFAVSVIDTKEASLRNLQTNELLDRSVGVRVRQNGGLGSAVEYNLNGMTRRSVGIFIDGMELATYGSSFNLNNIPPAMIERIEVYKGVLPAYLAGDYLGGAINIVLKKEFERNYLNFSLAHGSFNTLQSDLSAMYRHPKTGFTVRTSSFYTYSDNNYEVWGKFARNTLPDGRMVSVRAKRFNDAYKTYGTRWEMGFTNVKWADDFTISYNVSYAYKQIQHGQYMTRAYMGRFTESQANAIGLNFSKKDFLTKNLFFKFNGIYSERSQYLQDTVSWNYNWFGEKMIGFHGKPIKTATGAQQGVPTMNTINRNIATIRASFSYDFSQQHKITFNYFYYAIQRNEEDRIRHISERKYTSSNQLIKNISTIAYENQLFGNKLKTNFFAKYYAQNVALLSPYADSQTGEYKESKSRHQTNYWGYGMASSWALSKKLIVLASAEKAIRMPDEQEIFGGPAENIVANHQLKSEASHNVNLGFRWGYWHIKKHQVLLALTGFVRNVRDKIMLR